MQNQFHQVVIPTFVRCMENKGHPRWPFSSFFFHFFPIWLFFFLFLISIKEFNPTELLHLLTFVRRQASRLCFLTSIPFFQKFLFFFKFFPLFFFFFFFKLFINYQLFDLIRMPEKRYVVEQAITTLATVADSAEERFLSVIFPFFFFSFFFLPTPPLSILPWTFVSVLETSFMIRSCQFWFKCLQMQMAKKTVF